MTKGHVVVSVRYNGGGIEEVFPRVAPRDCAKTIVEQVPKHLRGGHFRGGYVECGTHRVLVVPSGGVGRLKVNLVRALIELHILIQKDERPKGIPKQISFRDAVHAEGASVTVSSQ